MRAALQWAVRIECTSKRSKEFRWALQPTRHASQRDACHMRMVGHGLA